jgi:hypothetical protein
MYWVTASQVRPTRRRLHLRPVRSDQPTGLPSTSGHEFDPRVHDRRPALRLPPLDVLTYQTNVLTEDLTTASPSRRCCR